MDCRKVHERWALTIFALVLLLGGAGLVVAQLSDEGTAEDGVYFPPDRPLMQRLSAAEELLAGERYSEAVRLLGSILESPQDFFFQPDPDTRVYRSLKSEAQRLIGTLPRAGRESYELQYGDEAEKLLETAAAAGDVDGLAEVSRRFFHTPAGYEATELLGTIHMREGRPLAAALCFKRLAENEVAAKTFEPALSMKLAICWSRAGMEREALAALAKLREQSPSATIEIAGKEQKFSPRADDAWLASLSSVASEVKLQDWLTHRGDVSRTAVSPGSAPLLNRRWSVPTINDPEWERDIEDSRLSLTEQGVACLPSGMPLAVDGYIFMRSLTGLVAVDSRTGKRVWHGPSDDSVRRLFESRLGAGSELAQGATVAIEERVWHDAIYNQLSSDGQRVFCVEGLGMSLGDPMRRVFAAGGTIEGEGTRLANRLAAYEIATEGKLAWDIGAGGSSTDPELREAFFLGPPLVLADRLYVLAEIRGEVRLLALDARTGELDWSQQLAVLEQLITEDFTRRMAGAMPSYSDGVLVCPTSAGAVVGVDLTTRSLLWAYQYGRSQDPRAQRIAAIQMGATPGANDEESWLDASVTIADGRVLLTPSESGELHCLNLLDGHLEWKQPRSDGLYAACVHKDALIVVGRGHVRAYRISDGGAAWSVAAPRLPTGVYPSGRGFYNGKDYFLPLSNAEIVKLDLETGRVGEGVKSRDGDVCGNLICYQGSVISQSAKQLESFYQIDDLRERVAANLADDPKDASAMALSGELLLNDGRVNDAVAQLRQSFEIGKDPRTRELLVAALVEGLRSDFPTYRKDAAEIESLIESPSQRFAYLREMAAGLQQAGDAEQAFETYLKISDLASQPDGTDELERVDSTLSVRRDRWIQARLMDVRKSVEGEQAEKIDDLLRARLTEAQQAKGVGPLRSFVSQFAFHPLADDARLDLVTRWPNDLEPIALERVLRHLEGSDDPVKQRAGTARLAMMLADRRYDDALPYIDQLAAWGELKCLDGRSGSELAKSLIAEHKAPTPKPWPSGAVEIDDLPGQQNPSVRDHAIEIRGPRGPFFGDKSVEIEHQTKPAIVGRDGLGRVMWRVPTVDRNDRIMGFNPTLSHASVDGHLLVISIGYEVLAIDTLGSDSQGPKVLWRETLVDNPLGARHMGVHGRVVRMPWGMQRFVASDSYGRPVGMLGPLSSKLVCFQRNRTLVAVDPATGQTVWMRHGLPPGCDLVGDDELLFVTEPNSSKAIVLSTLDGRELGRRRMPPADERLMVRGRTVVLWRLTGGRAVVSARDLWTEEELWRETFDSTAKPWPIDDEAVAVLERQGQFVILDADNGKKQLDTTIDPEPSLNDIYVLRTPDRDLLIVNRPQRNVNVQPVPGGFGNPMINGLMYGFDRKSGELVYSTPVEGRGLTFNQPADLPVLMFVSQLYRQSKPGRPNTPEVMLLCIDKRDGRVLIDKETLGPIAGVELVGNEEHDEVTVRTVRSALRLRFTDKPDKPKKTDAKKQGEKT